MDLEFLRVHFPVSGVDTWIFLPPLVAFVVSTFTSMGGVSGAFLLLPFQVSFLHFTSPSVSATNFVFNMEPFGEVPVFASQQFPANAEAMEQSRVFFFPRKSFVDLIRKNPSLALNMLAVLSKRLRRFAALVDDLSLKEVPGRLAAYLLYLSDQHKGAKDLELTITKAQLASLLGTIPETLSRILAKLGSQGLIETDGRRIRILKKEALQDLAESGGRL